MQKTNYGKKNQILAYTGNTTYYSICSVSLSFRMKLKLNSCPLRQSRQKCVSKNTS